MMEQGENFRKDTLKNADKMREEMTKLREEKMAEVKKNMEDMKSNLETFKNEHQDEMKKAFS
jgi:hypothetical protein